VTLLILVVDDEPEVEVRREVIRGISALWTAQALLAFGAKDIAV
jgi:hypothetical protein